MVHACPPKAADFVIEYETSEFFASPRRASDAATSSRQIGCQQAYAFPSTLALSEQKKNCVTSETQSRLMDERCTGAEFDHSKVAGLPEL